MNLVQPNYCFNRTHFALYSLYKSYWINRTSFKPIEFFRSKGILFIDVLLYFKCGLVIHVYDKTEGDYDKKRQVYSPYSSQDISLYLSKEKVISTLLYNR